MNKNWHEGRIKGLKDAVNLAHGMAYTQQVCGHPIEATVMSEVWKNLKTMLHDAESEAAEAARAATARKTQ